MKDFSHMLNDILVEVYHNILRVEEEFLRNNSKIDLSIREMHLIECVGMNKDTGKTVSEIADYLKIARPSVTVAVNKLKKKGYLEKQGYHSDGRIVRVTLTPKGKRVDAYHKRYHMNMVRDIENEFNENEREILLRTIDKLNNFFKESVGATT